MNLHINNFNAFINKKLNIKLHINNFNAFIIEK